MDTYVVRPYVGAPYTSGEKSRYERETVSRSSRRSEMTFGDCARRMVWRFSRQAGRWLHRNWWVAVRFAFWMILGVAVFRELHAWRSDPTIIGGETVFLLACWVMALRAGFDEI